MRKLLVCVLLFFSAPAFAQQKGATSPAASNLFLELGGNAGLFSLNYDRRFSNKNNGFGGRIGGGFAYVSGHIFGNFIFTVPVAINYLTGSGPHHLEAGAGVTFGTEGFGHDYMSERKRVFFVPNLGYRYQPMTKRFTFRAVASPMFASGISNFSGGISFGRRF